MLSQGLSHVIFNASNAQCFQHTLEFYEVLGFKAVADRSQEGQSEERVTWLRLGSQTSVVTDATIKLVLNASALTQHKPCGDVDWSLEEFALAFTIKDINVRLIDKLRKPSHKFNSQH